MTGDSASRALVLVHGAWHGSWCWEKLTPILAAASIRAVTIELPFTSFEADVEAICCEVNTIGSDVVLCGHSYGGRLISTAAKSLANVSHLVYVSAQVLNARQLKDIRNNPRPTSTAVPDESTIRKVYYNECSDAVIRSALARFRTMESVPGGLRGLDSRPWQTKTATYVICTRDRAIDVSRQRTMAANVTYQAELVADHAPFYSAVPQLSDLLMKLVIHDQP